MTKISESTIRRLSNYYRFLEEMENDGQQTVSSQKLAERGNITPAKVRKDLSYFGSFGRRGLGYDVVELKKSIKKILGVDHKWRVMLIGAGNLGAALVSFEEFQRSGFEIVAVLDKDPDKIGWDWNGVIVQDIDRVEDIVSELDIDIAILAVPAKSAIPVARQLIDVGIKTILNFAPIKLPHHEGITIRDVNLTIELESLTYKLRTDMM